MSDLQEALIHAVLVVGAAVWLGGGLARRVVRAAVLLAGVVIRATVVLVLVLVAGRVIGVAALVDVSDASQGDVRGAEEDKNGGLHRCGW